MFLLSATIKRPKGKVAYVLQVKTTKIMKVLAKGIDLCHIGILGPIYLYLKLSRKCQNLRGKFKDKSVLFFAFRPVGFKKICLSGFYETNSYVSDKFPFMMCNSHYKQNKGYILSIFSICRCFSALADILYHADIILNLIFFVEY